MLQVQIVQDNSTASPFTQFLYWASSGFFLSVNDSLCFVSRERLWYDQSPSSQSPWRQLPAFLTPVNATAQHPSWLARAPSLHYSEVMLRHCYKQSRLSIIAFITFLWKQITTRYNWIRHVYAFAWRNSAPTRRNFCKI